MKSNPNDIHTDNLLSNNYAPLVN